MSTDVGWLLKQRQSIKAESKRLARLLKQSRVKLAYDVRRDNEKRAHWREVGLRILAIAPDGITALKRFLKTEHHAEPEEQTDAAYELIVQEFLERSLEEIVALAEPIAADAKAYFEAAQDIVVKSELFSWTSSQNITKGVAPSVATLLEKKQKFRSSIAQNNWHDTESRGSTMGRV